MTDTFEMAMVTTTKTVMVIKTTMRKSVVVDSDGQDYADNGREDDQKQGRLDLYLYLDPDP